MRAVPVPRFREKNVVSAAPARLRICAIRRPSAYDRTAVMQRAFAAVGDSRTQSPRRRHTPLPPLYPVGNETFASMRKSPSIGFARKWIASVVSPLSNDPSPDEARKVRSNASGRRPPVESVPSRIELPGMDVPMS